MLLKRGDLMEKKYFTEEQKRQARARWNQRAYTKRYAGRLGGGGGGSERKKLLQVGLPEQLISWLHRLTNEAIAKGTHPWRSTADCVRDMLQRGMQTLDQDDGTVMSQIRPLLEIESQLAALENTRKTQLAFLGRGRTQIDELIRIGCPNEAGQYYRTFMKAVRACDPDVWRDHVIAQMTEAYPDLEKGAKGAALVAGGKASRQKVQPGRVHVRAFPQKKG